MSSPYGLPIVSALLLVYGLVLAHTLWTLFLASSAPLTGAFISFSAAFIVCALMLFHVVEMDASESLEAAGAAVVDELADDGGEFLLPLALKLIILPFQPLMSGTGMLESDRCAPPSLGDDSLDAAPSLPPATAPLVLRTRIVASETLRSTEETTLAGAAGAGVTVAGADGDADKVDAELDAGEGASRGARSSPA